MKKNIAVVGAGYWGKNLVRVFYELGALNTICDVDKELGSKYKLQFQNIKFIDSFKHLLSDSSLKAVVIAILDGYKDGCVNAV